MIDIKDHNKSIKDGKKEIDEKKELDKLLSIPEKFDADIINMKDIENVLSSFESFKKESKKMAKYLDIESNKKTQKEEKHLTKINNNLEKKRNKIIISIIIISIIIILYKSFTVNNINHIMNGGNYDEISLPFSNYGSIILTTVTIISIIYFLKLRKLKMICICGDGGWWYSCAQGTGEGSEMCNIYNKYMDGLDYLGSQIKFLLNNLVNFRNIIIRAITNSLNKVKNAFKYILNRIPGPPNLFKFVNQLFPPLNVRCGFKIWPLPYINPCAPLNAAWNGISQGIKAGFGLVCDGLKALFKALMSGIMKSLNMVQRLVSDIIKNVLKPLFLIIRGLKMIMAKLTDAISSVLDIGIFKILVFQVASVIQNIFGLADIGGVLSSALVFVLFVVCMPILGGLFLIISFLYMIIKPIIQLIYMIIEKILNIFLYGTALVRLKYNNYN